MSTERIALSEAAGFVLEGRLFRKKERFAARCARCAAERMKGRVPLGWELGICVSHKRHGSLSETAKRCAASKAATPLFSHSPTEFPRTSHLAAFSLDPKPSLDSNHPTRIMEASDSNTFVP